MKRIAMLVLAAVMSLGSFGAAEAVEIKASGHLDFGFGWVDGSDFHKNSGQDSFHAGQRLRTQIDIVASETLKAVVFFQIGQIDWGRSVEKNTGPGSGGALGAKGVNIQTRRAYIDWVVPSTNLSFRIGLQGLDLPAAVAGSPIFDEDVAAFVGNYKFNDKFSLTAFWARPFDERENDGWDKNIQDETDMFGLIAPITLDGFNITPWGVYSRIGFGSEGARDLVIDPLQAPIGTHVRNSIFDQVAGNLEGKHANAWWAGLAFEMDLLDPLIFKFDVMYGGMKAKDIYRNSSNDRTGDFKMDGWFLDAMLEYKTGFGVPGLFGWWASGMGSNDVRKGKYNMMPVIAGGFVPTTFGFDGAENDMSYDTVLSTSGVGMWGIGLQMRDMSFIQDLSHTLRVTYMRGTNSKEAVRDLGSQHIFYSADDVVNGGGRDYLNLATSEGAFEVNFDHKYKIYENLDMFVDLAYIHLDLDRGLRSNARLDKDEEVISKNAWKAMAGFRFSF